VLAYVTRERDGRRELLVFDHRDHPNAGTQVVAGRLEPGEDIERGLVRELLEEAGLRSATIVRKIGVYGPGDLPHGRGYTNHAFEVRAADAPDVWEHVVFGDGDDAGLVFVYRWEPLSTELRLWRTEDPIVRRLVDEHRATQGQLSALARVTQLLGDAAIDYWLFGGWAVDFYVGSVTRPHDDLDLAVWRDDVPRIAELLLTDGWVHAPLPDEDGGTGFEREGVRLELTFVIRDDSRVSTPLTHGLATWPEDAFRDDVRELRGVRARVLDFAALLRGKSEARGDPAEAAKDREDFERLSDLY
jgi:ADP-ribose pyrophosphatase YjhB (NUDIX family)